MNKLLPKTKSNQKGFTLIELLVVIVILGILGVVGVTLFSNTQSGARDAKRKEDIGAIADAMEVNYKVGVGYATPISTTWFADQIVPFNPGPGGTTYQSPTITTASFVVCASLENSTGNATSSTFVGAGTSTGNWFCKRNSQ